MREFLMKYMPPDYSLHGKQIDDLIFMVHVLMAILFVGWGLYFLYVLYRFSEKRSPRADYIGVRTHASSYIEAGVAAVEIILLVVISIPAWYRWATPPDKSKNPLEIRVVAEQFAWNVHYPGPDGVFGRTEPRLVGPDNPLGLDREDPAGRDDITTINRLNLPVGKPAIIFLSSKDVVHSLGLPQMRVKQDAIPGLIQPVWFTPMRTGQWDIACSQLCGIAHFRMKGVYEIQSQADFDAFLKEEASYLQQQ